MLNNNTESLCIACGMRDRCPLIDDSNRDAIHLCPFSQVYIFKESFSGIKKAFRLASRNSIIGKRTLKKLSKTHLN